MGHGKSGKMSNNYFPRTTKQKMPQTNDHFRIILKTTSRFYSRSWETSKSPVKGHGILTLYVLLRTSIYLNCCYVAVKNV